MPIAYEGSTYYICEVCNHVIIFIDGEETCACNKEVMTTNSLVIP
jgi:hypothetical protein